MHVLESAPSIEEYYAVAIADPALLFHHVKGLPHTNQPCPAAGQRAMVSMWTTSHAAKASNARAITIPPAFPDAHLPMTVRGARLKGDQAPHEGDSDRANDADDHGRRQSGEERFETETFERSEVGAHAYPS